MKLISKKNSASLLLLAFLATPPLQATSIAPVDPPTSNHGDSEWNVLNRPVDDVLNLPADMNSSFPDTSNNEKNTCKLSVTKDNGISNGSVSPTEKPSLDTLPPENPSSSFLDPTKKNASLQIPRFSPSRLVKAFVFGGFTAAVFNLGILAGDNCTTKPSPYSAITLQLSDAPALIIANSESWDTYPLNVSMRDICKSTPEMQKLLDDLWKQVEKANNDTTTLIQELNDFINKESSSDEKTRLTKL